jgi:hypothetical protein
VFRYGIKASITGTLEVAEVVVCSHGDDGGTLWADKLRTRVLSYSLYFPKPEFADAEALFIGDVYGDKSFPHDRANEIFVAEAIDEGTIDEGKATDLLRAGSSIIRSS